MIVCTEGPLPPDPGRRYGLAALGGDGIARRFAVRSSTSDLEALRLGVAP